MQFKHLLQEDTVLLKFGWLEFKVRVFGGFGGSEQVFLSTLHFRKLFNRQNLIQGTILLAIFEYGIVLYSMKFLKKTRLDDVDKWTFCGALLAFLFFNIYYWGIVVNLNKLQWKN